jgi:hypothetical protein
MLVPDKDPHIITAEKLLAAADEAIGGVFDYERVTALAALAQAHIAAARHSTEVEAATDVLERLTLISDALTDQIPD